MDDFYKWQGAYRNVCLSAGRHKAEIIQRTDHNKAKKVMNGSAKTNR